MNALLPLFGSSGAVDASANILAAAKALVPSLARAKSLDRRVISTVMTTCFGGSDAQGAWSWRDAYDAVEVALVLQMRRLGPQLGRLEDAPAEIVALLAALTALAPTHSRRSEEQVALDQFSTPPALAAIAVLAAQVRPGDRVLEPSAGTGLIAVMAEACGAELTLNEIAVQRANLLDALFPTASRTRHDGALLQDLLPDAGAFHAVIANPPFRRLQSHLEAAIACLADGGRLAAIVPASALEDRALLAALERRASVVALQEFPAGAFLKHGTSVDTGLLVVDRAEGGGVAVAPVVCETLADAALAAARIPLRGNAQARVFRTVSQGAMLQPRTRGVATPSSRFAFLSGAAPLDFELIDWRGAGRDVGLYQAYALGRIAIPGAAPHPSALVESGPMASVCPPAPSRRPLLPPRLVEENLISEAQAETVIYAGEAHAAMLPGRWMRTDAPHELALATPQADGAFQLRRGFFLGDGTGCGKGRQIAAVIADNIAEGRVRAVWLSKNEALLEDARRDWCSIGGSAADIVPLATWKLGEAVRLDRGILFVTYAMLRQPARGGKTSRLDQLVAWLGDDFDGVIVFDEAHAMANAAGSGKGSRGPRKASLQGQAGLALQNRLPGARVLYVSATGATTPENLAYAARLGLWGGPDAPFVDRAAFLDAVEKGGVAVMELIARELKAMGLYIARLLSFEGVEYEPLRHALTPENIEIWDAWADAFQLIHANLRAALEAVGISEEGKAKSPLAASAALSAFEGAKLRFFAHLLAGMKAPTLIASIRADLAVGHSAVVQIVSTNEAVMERRLAEIPPEEWNNLAVDLTPKEYVLDYLRGAFPVTRMIEVEDGEGGVSLQPLYEDGRPVISQEALGLREQLITRLACLPAVSSVLDAVLEGLGPDHVAEITGRSRRVVLRDGRRVVERRGSAAAKAETDAFMAGRKRVLIFSDAGGTGRSYHADLGAANRQRRVHYLVEPGWRADAAIQGLGRSHRTNQAHAPLFRPVTTDIHGEKRFLSTIARRLDSLGALTRGERRTAGAGLFNAEDNLESPWARKALLVFYSNLHWGEVACMDRETFEAKTGLTLVDGEGQLRKSDDLPPMNTFLNRVLALRIADQNAIFSDFEKILSSLLERAAASGALDRGIEDIVADEVAIVDEEVIRTDEATGAETRIVTFDVRTRRELAAADEALSGLDRDSLVFAVNAKSHRPALVVRGLTTTDDDDRMVQAVRLVRPEARRVVTLKSYDESAWEAVAEETWRAAWEAELADTDPWHARRLVMVSGLLLPVWTRLPDRQSQVRRLKAPDGRRWLGRVLDPAQVPALKVAVGATDVASAVGGGDRAVRLLLEDGAALALTGGLWIRRARVMDRWRIEVVGAASQRPAFTALGCFVEIINYTPRVFVPTDKPSVLDEIFRRWPVETLLPARQAAA